ncbi:MAG: LacI family DNA-binding transcriptional regulator [Eubacterium sp.]|nr:LacI family DNA-binding transcriptional regulator [Eubacterium sp.]
MATIKDVAREAGIAVGTVSRVLNNRGYISEETRNKVYAAMKKLNYQPNETARSLQKKKSNMIGVIVPQIAHPYFAMLISCLEIAAYNSDYRIILLNSQGQETLESEFLKLCRRNQVVGIILCNGNLDIAKIEGLSIPVVTIERKMEGGDAAIECDNEMGGELAAQHLIDRGCRHLLHIGGVTNDNMPAENRGHGFMSRCSRYPVEARMIHVPFEDYRMQSADKLLNQFLDENPEADGIFVSDDILAAELIKVCLKRGIRIPEDLKIVGFDDTDVAKLISPPLTTVHQPVEEMAEQAINLIQRMEQGEPAPSRTIFPVELVIRETT